MRFYFFHIIPFRSTEQRCVEASHFRHQSKIHRCSNHVTSNHKTVSMHRVHRSRWSQVVAVAIRVPAAVNISSRHCRLDAHR